MKKIILIASTIILSLGLTACGSSSTASQPPKQGNTQKKTTNKNTTPKSTTKKKTNKVTNGNKKNTPVGATKKSKIGTETIIARKEGFQKTYTSGPFKLILEGYQIATLKPSDQLKPMFNNKNKTTIIALKMKVQNTSKKDLDFYPGQGTITTNTGAQAHAKTMLSGKVGGTFYGAVHKEGEVFFQVDSPAKKIKKITFIVSGPNDQNMKSIGKQLKISIPIK